MLLNFLNDKQYFSLSNTYTNFSINVTKDQLLAKFSEVELISLFNKNNKFWNVKEL